jgi:hypothetical protein
LKGEGVSKVEITRLYKVVPGNLAELWDDCTGVEMTRAGMVGSRRIEDYTAKC